jgi:hypothetical protein
MSQMPAGDQIGASKPVNGWAAINVIVLLLVLGLIGWAATLQRRNRELERKVAVLEKGPTSQAAGAGAGKGKGSAANAEAAVTPHKGQPPAPASVAGRSKRRKTPATAPATTQAAANGAAPAAGGAAARKLVSDEELARIGQLQETTRQRVETGTATMLDSLRAQRLLNRAKYLHGDLTREQYQQEADRLAADVGARLLALEQAGRAEPATVMEFYELLLSERR